MKRQIHPGAGSVLLILGFLLSFVLWSLQPYLPAVLAGSGTWTSKQGMPTGRLGAGGDVINGLFYIAGGDKSNLDFTAALEVYNPANNTWATKKDMPTARRYFGAAAIDGKLYTVGGGRAFGTYYNNLEVYDPVKDEWATKMGAPTARHSVAAAAINGKLYVTGGNDRSAHRATLEVYDPAKDEWTTKKNHADSPLWSHSCCYRW